MPSRAPSIELVAKIRSDMRVVLDANVLISGALAKTQPASTIGRLMLALDAIGFKLVSSQSILSEVRENLPRVLLSMKTAEFDINGFLEYLRDTAEVVEITDVEHGVATHREDDWILATAVLGEVEFLVTGDKQLLALNEYRGVKIITPRQLVDLRLYGSNRP